MRTIYLYIENSGILRKVSIDMSYLASHKKIRLLKFYYEEGLYLAYQKDLKNKSSLEKYYLTKDKIISEDKDHLFFKFPFKIDQVLNIAI